MINDLKYIEKRIIPILKRNDVEFAAIFGSRARGEARSDSDLDIIIRYNEFKRKSLFDLIGLEQELGDTLGIKVDLGTEGSLHPLVKPNVEKDLKVLYGQRHAV